MNELPRYEGQCGGCEGRPAPGNDPCDVCGRTSAMLASPSATPAREVGAEPQEGDLPARVWLNDLGTSQKLSFAPIEGAAEHFEYVPASPPVGRQEAISEGWFSAFEELLEDYAGARAETAVFNVTQRSGMTVRMARPRLEKLMAHVRALASAPIERAPDPARAVLAELVALKDLKDQIERWVKNDATGEQWPAMPCAERMAACDEYKRRKPAAWAAARAFVKEQGND